MVRRTMRRPHGRRSFGLRESRTARQAATLAAAEPMCDLQSP